MTYEVEFKFPVAGHEALTAALDSMNASPAPRICQCDRYFNHPSRDFGETDEALRIRSVGDSNCVTYKGQLLDAVAKTRREIEVGVADGPDAAERFREVLLALGFRETLAVRKTRTPFQVEWEQRAVEVVLDDVDGLGTFVELETITDHEQIESARDSLLRLAGQLGLSESTNERRSYLQLLLEKDRC